MADGDPIIIGKANLAINPNLQTRLNRYTTSSNTLFSVRAAGGGDSIYGFTNNGTGVNGESSNSIGVRGIGGSSSIGVGVSGSGYYGVEGRGTNAGVRGTSYHGDGVTGHSYGFGNGVSGSTDTGIGYGVYGRGPSGAGGYFDGGITVVKGNKNFKIDHPLDPENSYLVHTCVESSEMKNVYDGVTQLHKEGAAWVELPEWFEALNGDFRYQLTAVGGSAPELHVAEEVSENRFRIAGGEEGMKVCWQVTGSRKDRAAAAHPFEVEQEKPDEERGRYLEPSLYGAPDEQRVMMGPPIVEAVEEEQRPPEPSDIDFARPEERLRQRMMQQPPQPPRPQFPPPPSMMPPSVDFGRLEEEHRGQIDELRRLVEEQRREIEELRRRVGPQEDAPPEST